jgi:hypothetical protein
VLHCGYLRRAKAAEPELFAGIGARSIYSRRRSCSVSATPCGAPEAGERPFDSRTVDAGFVIVT